MYSDTQGVCVPDTDTVTRTERGQGAENDAEDDTSAGACKDDGWAHGTSQLGPNLVITDSTESGTGSQGNEGMGKGGQQRSGT